MNKDTNPTAIRLKYIANINMGQSPPSNEYSLSSSEGLPFLQGTAEFGMKFPEPRFYCSVPTKIAQKGDILFSVRAPVGELNIATQDTGIGRGLCAIRPMKNFNQGFAWWALHEAKYKLNFISTGSTYEAVSTEDIANLPVKVSAIKIQSCISEFLDRETARIESLIAAKEHWLNLLAEKRRALITHTVTRGCNPKVPLKDSGIPWLGKIPKHWELWKLGHTSKIGNGSTPNRDESGYWADGAIPWLNSSVVNQDEVNYADQFITQRAFNECHLPLVSSGSVLIAITGQGKTRGKAVVLSMDATINQHLAFITPVKNRLEAWYLRWILFAAYEFLRSISDDTGGTKGALTCEEINNFHIPIPPLSEQVAIFNLINMHTIKLSLLQNATARTLSLLKERRTALISAAVTGKVAIN